MPLKQHGASKARPLERRLATAAIHYHILAADGLNRYRLAVSVKSQFAPSGLESLIAPRFQHFITESVERPEPGGHPLPTRPGGRALDYLRAGLLGLADLSPLPFAAPGSDNSTRKSTVTYSGRWPIPPLGYSSSASRGNRKGIPIGGSVSRLGAAFITSTCT
ncbi:MAG: DUF2278 family protein [Candidatus Competibacter sp.]|nr:DUF2278 family protein [Candidatus Competibacter sp.]